MLQRSFFTALNLGKVSPPRFPSGLAFFCSSGVLLPGRFVPFSILFCPGAPFQYAGVSRLRLSIAAPDLPNFEAERSPGRLLRFPRKIRTDRRSRRRKPRLFCWRLLRSSCRDLLYCRFYKVDDLQCLRGFGSTHEVSFRCRDRASLC